MKTELNKSIRRIKIYSIGTLLLIVIGSAVSYWTAGKIEFYTNALMDTQVVIQQTDKLYASILERETNIRGYALTKEERFLELYRQSVYGTDILLEQLEMSTVDNASQQNNIAELKNLISTRLRSFETTLTHIEENGSIAAYVDSTTINNALLGYQMIKSSVIKIKEVENQLFLARNQNLINNINALPFIIGLISLFSITIGLITFFSISQYNKAEILANIRINDFQTRLKDKIQLLDESNKELEQFAYVASHDLQEPLRKITAFSDLLVEQYDGKLEGDGKLYLSRITAAANRMRKLITDLLEYSRAGRESLDVSGAVNLSKVVKEVLEDMEISIQNTSATITYKNLPTVTGKESGFRQVFQNLLSNALKFSKGTIPPQIEITSEQAPSEIVGKFTQLDQNLDYFLVKIEDNGIGFNQEYADRIFSIFQRLHGKKEYEGTGIGLSITRKIIEKNGGVIFATSQKEIGSVFSILLPRITA